MENLILHPACAPGAIHAITASIEPTATGCRAVFEAHGAIDRITIPPLAEAGRFDDLWKTTCFEIFWQTGGGGDGAPYREFNLSPSSRWACYDFDAFRLNSRDGPAEVEISVSVGGGVLKLVANIVSDLPLPANIALNAIIEEDGVNRYWALAFPDGKPEFHSQANRKLRVEARKCRCNSV